MHIKIPDQKDTCSLVPQQHSSQRKDIKSAALHFSSAWESSRKVKKQFCHALSDGEYLISYTRRKNIIDLLLVKMQALAH